MAGGTVRGNLENQIKITIKLNCLIVNFKHYCLLLLNSTVRIVVTNSAYVLLIMGIVLNSTFVLF
jgi:hypothetical protein